MSKTAWNVFVGLCLLSLTARLGKWIYSGAAAVPFYGPVTWSAEPLWFATFVGGMGLFVAAALAGLVLNWKSP